MYACLCLYNVYYVRTYIHTYTLMCSLLWLFFAPAPPPVQSDQGRDVATRVLYSVCKYAHTYIHTYICTDTYIHAYTYVYMYMYIHTYVYMYICTYVHIHSTYVCVHCLISLVTVTCQTVNVLYKHVPPP